MKHNLRTAASFLLCAASLAVCSTASAEWTDSIRYRAEVGTTLSAGEHTPLWLNANRYGFSTTERNNVWLRLSAFKDLDTSKRFSWGAGIDMGVAHRMQSTFMPQQLYAEVKYRCLNAFIGAKEWRDPMLDQDLSSGAMTHGWNARPIPQIRVGIFEYADVWGCKGMFAIKGHVAYGMFDDNWWINRWADKESKYTLSTLYCSRAIWFRGGNKEKFPLTGELGLIMDSQFGGKTWDYNFSEKRWMWNKHPRDLKAFVKALIPMHGSASTSAGEQANVEGNYLGNWNLSLQWDDPTGWMVKLYYQHFFEDHSMLFFDYTWKDGLYGVQGRLPKNPFVSDIVYEFLYTKDQSGPVYWDHVPDMDYQVSARDDYYNNYIYNGWQHWGQGIGNPLITSPIYNANHHLTFYSNRIVAHNFGFKGNPSTAVSYRVHMSYTKSWGTYPRPFMQTEEDFSWLAEVRYHPLKLKGWEASLSLAGDHGKLLGNSFGAMLSISKSGFFK